MLTGQADRGESAGAATTLVGARGGWIAARFAQGEHGTTITDLSEGGGYRLALPTTFAAHVEAAQINTGGGVAGGDHVATRITACHGSDVVFSTQGAERVYRTTGPASQIAVALTLAGSARLDWLPQQTIVFAGARLERRIDVEMAAGGRLLMTEIVTFGRPASAERREPVDVCDHWRIRRDGRLVFAEAFRLCGIMSQVLDRPAIGGGARSSAIVLLVAPDAADRLEAARAALAMAPCEAGVSGWNGLLCARLLGQRPADVIAGVAGLARALAGRAMPRVWSI